MICTKEIEEFHKFIYDLNHSDYLCVVSYKFNSEDNHINSIISEWLHKNKKNHLLFFNHKKSLELESLSWVQNEHSIEDINSIYISSDNIANIFNSSKNIINIQVENDKISLDTFEKVINHLNKVDDLKDIYVE